MCDCIVSCEDFKVLASSNPDFYLKIKKSLYLQTSTFNSKVTEVENKIRSSDIIAKSANTKANTIRSDLTGYGKKLKLLQILLQ